MWKLLVILPVIKYSMLVFRKCQVYPSEILDKHRILEYFNQTLHLIGSIIWVLGPSRVLGFCRVLGPRRVLGPPRVPGPPRILDPHRGLGPHRVLVPGSHFSSMSFFIIEIIVESVNLIKMSI